MKDKKLIIVTLALVGFYISAQGVPGPVLAVIARSLRITDRSMLSLVLTLPPLFTIPMMLLVGAFADRVNKKMLVCIGGMVYLTGALGPLFWHNFAWILGCRSIQGLGCGILFPLPYTMILDYFEGQSRHTVLGIQTAASSMWGAACVALSGILGRVTWQHSFYIYIFGFVPLLSAIFFLPAVKKAQPVSVAAGERKKSGTLAPVTYLYGLGLVFFFASTGVVANLVPFYVESEGLGGPRTVGFTSAVGLAATFAAGLSFGPLFGFLKEWSGAAAVAVAALGFLLLSIAPGVPILVLGRILIGSGMGFIFPVLMTWAAKSSPNAPTLSLAIVQVGLMLGMFTSTLFVKLLAVMGGMVPRTAFFYVGVLLSAMTLVFVIAAMKPSTEETAPVMQRDEELVAN